jgi:hypothetical protein
LSARSTFFSEKIGPPTIRKNWNSIKKLMLWVTWPLPICVHNNVWTFYSRGHSPIVTQLLDSPATSQGSPWSGNCQACWSRAIE